MAKRPNLASVDLIDQPRRRPGRPRVENPESRRAQTLRLPDEYWHRLRISAALRKTTGVAIVRQALDDWFQRYPLPPGYETTP
jgi:transposase